MSVPDHQLDPDSTDIWCSACHRYHEVPSECPEYLAEQIEEGMNRNR